MIEAMPEPDVADLLTVAQAMAVIDAAEVEPQVARVPLSEARGMRLAEALTADRDAPPFHKSQMDGYAVRCADVASASRDTPVLLKVVGEIPAGSAAHRELQSGEAFAIMTGAPMPVGADGVVPVEETRRRGSEESGEQGEVSVEAAAVRGRYVAPPGSDVRAGEVVLKRGVLLEAAQLAVAASVGAAFVPVFTRPRVAVLSTGDELVPVDRTPGEHQIRSSNNAMLVALLAKMGCEVVDLGTARDTPEEIGGAMEEALASADVLFVSGGMSMGTRDYVPRMIRELGFVVQVSKLRIKPGKPFVFATRTQQHSMVTLAEPRANGSRTAVVWGHKYIFGLPGNPVSAFVCTIRLASRLLVRLAGGVPVEKWLSGKLEQGLGPNGTREFYQPVVWTPAVGGAGGGSNRSEFATVTAMTWKGSADIYTLAAANAFLVRVENEPPLGKGTLVRVLEI